MIIDGDEHSKKAAGVARVVDNR